MWRRIGEIVRILRAAEPAAALDNATPFLWAFGHAVVAWLWLDQALAARRTIAGGGGDPDFVAGKLRACRFFFECELPKTDAWLAIVASGSDIASGAALTDF